MNQKIEREITEDLNEKVGLILEYYSRTYESEDVIEITKKIQDIYDMKEDMKEPTIDELRPLLKELYRNVVKREFHSDLLLSVLKEMEEKD